MTSIDPKYLEGFNVGMRAARVQAAKENIRKELDYLINATPAGEVREQLTAINVLFLSLDN